MPASYSIITKHTAQTHPGWREHISSLKIYGQPKLEYLEPDNRYPSLREIYTALEEADIQLVEDRKTLVVDHQKNTSPIWRHSLQITDSQTEHDWDFTMNYPEGYREHEEIKTLLGITSDLRILWKLFAQLSKQCGSFLMVLNPYEAYYVDRNQDFEEALKNIPY